MFKRASWNTFHDELQDEDAPKYRSSDSEGSDSDSGGDENISEKMKRKSERHSRRAQMRESGWNYDSNSSDSEV
jgi:hypothetical protein